MKPLSQYNELSEYDFQIILKLYKSSPMNEKDIIDAFPKQKVVRLRLLALSNYGSGDYLEYLTEKCVNDDGSDDYVYTNDVAITELGIKAAEDYLLQQKQNMRQKWEDRLLKTLPIIMSTIALIKSFWNEINELVLLIMQQWR